MKDVYKFSKILVGWLPVSGKQKNHWRVGHIFTFFFFHLVNFAVAQNGWTTCTAPVFNSRIDDIFMVNTQTGYAVSGDGQIVKTIDGGPVKHAADTQYKI